MRFKAEEIIFGNANVIQLLPAKRPHATFGGDYIVQMV